MPYPRAHFWVLLVIAVTVAGFWESYFSTFTGGPWQFHAHGIGASIWVLLVAAQSWTAHRRQFGWHAAAGKASLFLFPFLIGGLAAIIDLTAKGFVAGEGPARAQLGGAFLIGLLLAIAAYVVLYYRALKFRRKVWLHAGYMLATPLILWESPFSRVLGTFVPGLGVAGPQDFGRIIHSIVWAMATALLFCLIVRWRVGERAQPFLVAALFIAAQMVAMGQLGDLAALRSTLTLIGHIPSGFVVAAGFAAGALTSWAGWNAGKRPPVVVAGAAQPA
ncbi:MAG TPA: hypothetical protein VF702_14875 [Allosphingosinicella sp.]|jgi:hypothetical protein